MSPLRDRRFVLLLAGQAVNGIGSWCSLVALWGYAAYRFDATPLQIALLSLSWALPGALFGPLGGIPVDRLGPRRALVVADACAALVAFALIFTNSYSQLVICGVLIGCASAVSNPAFSALAPRLVPDELLLRANALLGAAMMSAIALGPLLAAGSIAAWGPRGAFAIDSITYCVGIAVVLPLRLRPVEHDRHAELERATAWHELKAGVGFVRQSANVRRILELAASVYAVWGAYAVIEPIFVRDVLHKPPSTFALLQAAFGVMLVLNALVVARAGDRVASLRTMRYAALATALTAPIYVGTHSVWVAFIAIAIWGSSTAWFIAPRNTLLQRATPTVAHGRVLAIDSAVQSWAHVIALPTAAMLVGWLGVRGAALTFALLPVIGAVASRRAHPEVDVEPEVQTPAQARNMLHA